MGEWMRKTRPRHREREHTRHTHFFRFSEFLTVRRHSSEKAVKSNSKSSNTSGRSSRADGSTNTSSCVAYA